MFSLPHHFQDLSKDLKILLLGRLHRVLSKEGYDLLAQFPYRTHAEPKQRFLVIIVPAINMNPTAAKEMLKRLKGRQAFRSLRYDELRKHLPTQLHHSTSLNRYGETTFSIDKSNDPADCF